MVRLMTSVFEHVADILDPPEWQPIGRPPLLEHQIPPDWYWSLWLIEAGRGGGKTEGCARYFAKFMRQNSGARGRIIAPTFGDAVESCITGPSGLLSIDPEIRWRPTEPGGAKVEWPNGSEALVFGTPTPRDVERFRAGGNRHIDWWEELAANPMVRTTDKENNAWDQAQLGLRLGQHPHSIASTTPRNSPKYRAIRSGDKVALTKATPEDNPYISREWLQEIYGLYGGTRLGRQEISGELLEDIEGALWTPTLVENTRKVCEEFSKVTVAVDPSGGSTSENDEQGIIVCGKGIDGHGYTIADRSCRLSPDGWGRRVIQAYLDNAADEIVYESNFGGDMVVSTIRGAARSMDIAEPHLQKVTATRGKQLRAQPVAALFEQNRAHLVSVFDELEAQMTSWTPENGESPDRLDAMVMALTHLMLEKEYSWRPLE